MILKLSQHEIANPDSAINLVIRLSALAQKIDYPAGQARALFEHGNILYQENRYNEALDKYNEALKLAQQVEISLVASDCLERMASVHLATDDPALALKLYFDALVLYEKVKDSLGIAKVYNILGVYKTDTEDYDSAKVFFEKAIAINENAHEQYPLIENRGNLAYMYGRKGEKEKAEKLFNELVEELILMKDSLGLPVTYFNLAELYQEKGALDTTLIFLDKAIRIAEPRKDTVLLSTLYGNKGEIFLKSGRNDSARWYLEKSVDCAQMTGDVETEAQALLFLIKVDSIAGDFLKTFEISKRVMVLNDSSARRRLRNNLKTTELNYENEKRKSLIELQDQKLDSARRQRIWYLVFLALLVIAGVLIGLVLILERKNHRKKLQIDRDNHMIKDLQVEKIRNDHEIDRLKLEKAEAELRGKERELLCIAMGIEQKNEFLNDISRQFRESLSDQPGANQEIFVNEIINSIKRQLSLSGETELFNQQFAAVHEEFHDNLKKAHPSLTKSELKFCAYLRLKISGNQIANQLNVTSEAIRKTRYRIRKKIGLNPGDSLEDYISNF